MLRILMVTARPEAVRPFSEALSTHPEVSVEQVASGAEALDAVRSHAHHLVVIDSEAGNVNPLALVSDLIMVNAMVNTAVMSPLSEEEFHEASEGLGVLAHLPLKPGQSEAAQLLEKLKTVLGVAL